MVMRDSAESEQGRYLNRKVAKAGNQKKVKTCSAGAEENTEAGRREGE